MTITRDPATGRELTTQLGNVTTERTYTTFGEPESYTAKFSGTEIYYEHYTYNKLGWITDLERRQNGFNENLHYEYDDRGRLAEVWRDGALESSYTYDENSNRLSYTGPLGNATGTYDARDRMLSYGGATYTWSEAGELMTKTEGGLTTTYDYDVFGNLRKVELPNGIEIEYLTDGAQRRIGKKVNGVLVKQWLYQDQLEPLAELDESGTIATFVYGTKRHVPEYLSKSGEKYRYIVDHLGSPRLLVNLTTGTVVQELRYSEFGQIMLDTSPGYQPFGFVAGMYERTLEAVRFGARDMEVTSGRWLERDPAGFGGGFSPYIYASNNPINFFDLLGLAPVPACVQAALGNYFPGMDWKEVQIEQGLPGLVKKFSAREPAAFTFGSTIYFAEGEYQYLTRSGMGLIAHELVHVEQFGELGKFKMSRQYLAEYRRNLKKTHPDGSLFTEDEAYDNISFERAAREREQAVLEDLNRRYPNDPSCGCSGQ